MGTPVPDEFQNIPFLNDSYLQRVSGAFWQLSTCRAIGQALGPIPWTATDQYARMHQFDSNQVEYDMFVYFIGQMDNTFLDQQRKMADRERKRSAAAAKRGRKGR